MDKGPTRESLEALVRLRDEAEAEVAKLRSKLKRAESRLRIVEEQLIPEHLAELGFEAATLADGTRVTVKEDIRASVPFEDRDMVNLTLEEMGHGGIVKKAIVVPFSAGDLEGFAELRDRLARDEYEVQQMVKVEPSTLSALVRELLAEGKPVPAGIKVFRQKKAVIKRS